MKVRNSHKSEAFHHTHCSKREPIDWRTNQAQRYTNTNSRRRSEDLTRAQERWTRAGCSHVRTDLGVTTSRRKIMSHKTWAAKADWDSRSRRNRAWADPAAWLLVDRESMISTWAGTGARRAETKKWESDSSASGRNDLVAKIETKTRPLRPTGGGRPNPWRASRRKREERLGLGPATASQNWTKPENRVGQICCVWFQATGALLSRSKKRRLENSARGHLKSMNETRLRRIASRNTAAHRIISDPAAYKAKDEHHK
jgi:hypothetical protein